MSSAIPACISVHHVNKWDPGRPQEGFESPGTRATDNVGLGMKQDPLEM